MLHDSRPGYEVCGASIAGEVELVRDARTRGLVDLVHERYVEPGSADSPAVRAYLASDDVALRLLPRHAWTWDERGSEASNALRALGGAHPLVPTEPWP